MWLCIELKFALHVIHMSVLVSWQLVMYTFPHVAPIKFHFSFSWSLKQTNNTIKKNNQIYNFIFSIIQFIIFFFHLFPYSHSFGFQVKQTNNAIKKNYQIYKFKFSTIQFIIYNISLIFTFPSHFLSEKKNNTIKKNFPIYKFIFSRIQFIISILSFIFIFPFHFFFKWKKNQQYYKEKLPNLQVHIFQNSVYNFYSFIFTFFPTIISQEKTTQSTSLYFQQFSL